MTGFEKTSQSPTVFEVDSGGTLRMADYEEASTRAEFYEDVADSWSGSPGDLLDAMEVCQPLAWEVEDLFQTQQEEGGVDEQDSSAWLLKLSPKLYSVLVVPVIQRWFDAEPNWSFEEDYLPTHETAQGAALAYFRDMEPEQAEALGVVIVEGDRPGSSYYAAELEGSLDRANEAARAAGIAVRFVRPAAALRH